MEKYIHLDLEPIFPGRAIFEKEMKLVWARFLDLRVEKGETDISLCSRFRNGLVFDKSFERIKHLKTQPSQHLYRVVQVKSLRNPGSLVNVKTREIQAICDFCYLEHHFLMEGVLRDCPKLQDFEDRYKTIDLLEEALKKPDPSWLPQRKPTFKPARESTRVFRDPNIYPGHLGG